MTTSHNEPPSIAGGVPASPDGNPGVRASSASAVHGQIQGQIPGQVPGQVQSQILALLPHMTVWWDRHRDIAQLAAPAAAYLAVVSMLVFGAWGLLVAAAASALLVKYGPAVSADTMLNLYRAQPIAPRQGAALRAALATLSERAGLPAPPAIAVVPSMETGAFSSGHGQRTAILLTEGLLRRYSLREIVAITAHEIAHMKAGDLPFFALGDVLTRLAQALSYLGIALLLLDGLAWLIGETVVSWWPIACLLLAPCLNSQLQLALSRQREYDADRLASSLLGGTDQIVALALAAQPDFGSPLDDFRLPVPQRRSPIPSPVRAHLAGAIRAERLRDGPPPTLLAPLTITDEPLISLVGVGPIEMRPRNRWPGLWF